MIPTVQLQEAPLKIQPGESASMPVTIRNDSGVIDDFSVDIVGSPTGWATVDPQVLPLFPGTEGQVTVTFRPPRDSSTPAGWTPFAVRVSSREDPAGTNIEEGVLQVLPFEDLTALLVPATARGRRTGRYKLGVENHGNAPTVATVTAIDPDRLLAIRVNPPQLALDPGKSGTTKLAATASIFFRGVPQHRTFQINVTPEDGTPQKLTGTFIHRSLFAGWLVRLALLALLLGGVLAYFVLRPAKVQSSATHQPVPLAVPADFTAQPVDTTSIRLAWSTVNTAQVSTYTIREITNGSAQVVAQPKGEESAHAITGLTPATTHCYQIQAANSAVVSGWSPQACARTLPLPPGPPPPGVPGQPAQLTATVLDSADIRLSWTAVAGATGYVIDESGQRVATAGAEETSHAFSGLQAGSTHCYNLQVMGPGGTSAPTAPVCATTVGAVGVAVPLPPQSVSVTAVDVATLRINFTDPNPTDTGIQIFENGGLIGTEPQGSSAHTIGGLGPGQQHCYQVRAINGALVSSFAPDQPVCGTTLTPSAAQLQSDPAIASFSVANTQLGQTGNRVAIGEFVNYQLTVSIPQTGVKNLTVSDILPSGMSFWSGSQAATTLGGTVTPDPLLTTDAAGGFPAVLQNASITSCATSIAGCTVTASNGNTDAGRVLTANFGDIVNGNTDPTKTQSLVFKFAAVVLDVAGNTASGATPTTLTNSAAVNYISGTGAAKSLPSPSTVLTVDEPALSLAVSQSGPATSPTIVVTVTHAASSGADAYSPTVTVVIPGLTGPVNAACNPACSGGAAGQSGNTITAKWPSLALGPSNSLILTIRVIPFPPLTPESVGAPTTQLAWQSLSDTSTTSSFNIAAHARSHPGVANASAVDAYLVHVP
jgi:uncharacterized repeat protein (TIGR01451 family)